MDVAQEKPIPSPWIPTSAATGDGIDVLMVAIDEELSRHDSEEVGSVLGTAIRCRDNLAGATKAIDSAIKLSREGDGHEFVAAELRLAARHLGEVTGAVYTDDILDRVFSRFCIGK